MHQNTGVSFNRKQLLECENAVCVHCEQVFLPKNITDWIDPNEYEIGQTACCPHCEVDAVIGFHGELDENWVKNFRNYHFKLSGGVGR